MWGSRLGEWRGRICKIISSSQLCHCVCSRAREASLAGLPSDTLRILVLSCSVVDPLWFQSGSSFFPECGSVSGSREPNQCGSMRIRILVRLKNHKKKNLYMKNIRTYLKENRSKNCEGTKAFSKVRKPSLSVNYGHFLCSWIRIRIPNSYSDPGQPNLCCLADLTYDLKVDLQASTKLCKKTDPKSPYSYFTNFRSGTEDLPLGC